MKKSLKRNIDNILDLIYSPSGVHPEIIESVSSALHLINKVGAQIERSKVSTTAGSSTEDESTEESS